MPVAAVPGNVRLRAFQLGLQTTFGTPVATTRRFPWSWSSLPNPNWTWPDADTGTLDYAIPPYRLRIDITGPATGILAYNDAPYVWAALTKSGVTPAANVWTFTPASTSQDSFEIFTADWGDETADQYRLGEGIIDNLQLVYPEDLGPVQMTANWRFGSVTYPHTITPGLSVDFAPTWVYAADTSIYIDSTAGGIGGTKLSDTVHGLTVDIQNNIDVKSFENGSNTRFQVAGYGRGLRTNTVTFNMAKTTAALAEVADWLNGDPVERFLAIDTVSPDIVTGALHYAHKLRFSGFWTTNSAGTYGTSNTTNQLVCNGWLDQTLAYPYQALVTCGLSSL